MTSETMIDTTPIYQSGGMGVLSKGRDPSWFFSPKALAHDSVTSSVVATVLLGAPPKTCSSPANLPLHDHAFQSDLGFSDVSVVSRPSGFENHERTLQRAFYFYVSQRDYVVHESGDH